MVKSYSIRTLASPTSKEIEQLSKVLIDCVQGDASVSFMHPLSPERSIEFWSTVALGIANGERRVLVAEDEQGICGTVQIILKQPDNQPHRADIAKMLVHRRARRRGIAAALLKAVEQTALECGKTLLVLDTVTSGDAERLYAKLGWERAGVIPYYALMPRGGYCSTTLFYKKLGDLADR